VATAIPGAGWKYGADIADVRTRFSSKGTTIPACATVWKSLFSRNGFMTIFTTRLMNANERSQAGQPAV
jgi:hypothetical protein